MIKPNIDPTKIPKLEKRIRHCEVASVPAGSLPKNVVVELPGADGARVLARWNGSPPGLVATNIVTLRRTVEGSYEVADLESAYDFGGWPFTTRNVDADGDGDDTTIQDGHDNAGTGDTVIVGPSDYAENVTLSKAITVVFLPGARIVGTLTCQTVAPTVIDLNIINNAMSGTVNVVQNSVDGTRLLGRTQIRDSGAKAEIRMLNTANDLTIEHADIVASGDATTSYGITGGTGAVITVRGGYIDGPDGDIRDLSGGITVSLEEQPTLENGLINGSSVTWTGSYANGSGIIFTHHLMGSFSVHRNGTNQTGIAASTFTKVEFTTEEFDRAGWFDNSTNYRLQPTIACDMQLNFAGMILNIPDATLIIAAIYKNGSLFKQNRAGPIGGAIGGASSNVSVVVNFNGSSDYVEFYIWHNSSSGNEDLGGAESQSHASGFLVTPA